MAFINQDPQKAKSDCESSIDVNPGRLSISLSNSLNYQ